MKKIRTDVLIVGSGVAGLICALELPQTLDITLITKKEPEDSTSYLAQGGISRSLGEEDRERFISDTMAAGHHKNNREAVEILVDESRAACEALMRYGVAFTKKNGELALTREGGHSRFRILYHEDHTGKGIMEALISQVRHRANIRLLTHCRMDDILEKEGRCLGCAAEYKGQDLLIYSRATVLATGGIGGLYRNTTSFPHIQGDGIAAAIRHGVRLKDLSYIQIHPTALYEEEPGRR